MPRIEPIHYETAPMSFREAGFLVRCYGYPDVSSFASSLPAGGSILDVGAGFSNLGRIVADVRRDISWLNVDLGYAKTEPDAPSRQFKLASESNIDSLQADVLNLQATLGSQQFDRVLSYWTLPYITLAGREAGILAARNMLEVVKPDGSLSVGPITGLNGFAKLLMKSKNTVTVNAPGSDKELDETANFIVDTTALGHFWSWMHKRASFRDQRTGEHGLLT